jgi:hypothetical protein
VQCVLGGEQQDATGTRHGEAAQTWDADGDRDGEATARNDLQHFGTPPTMPTACSDPHPVNKTCTPKPIEQTAKSTINRPEPHNPKKGAPRGALLYPNDQSPHSVWSFTAGNTCSELAKVKLRPRKKERELAALELVS